eukprot:s1146_g13.t1
MSGTPSCSEQRVYGTCTAQDGLQGVALKRPDGAIVVVMLNAANLSVTFKLLLNGPNAGLFPEGQAAPSMAQASEAEGLNRRLRGLAELARCLSQSESEQAAALLVGLFQKLGKGDFDGINAVE